jgi:hypothetical protein
MKCDANEAGRCRNNPEQCLKREKPQSNHGKKRVVCTECGMPVLWVPEGGYWHHGIFPGSSCHLQCRLFLPESDGSLPHGLKLDPLYGKLREYRAGGKEPVIPDSEPAPAADSDPTPWGVTKMWQDLAAWQGEQLTSTPGMEWQESPDPACYEEAAEVPPGFFESGEVNWGAALDAARQAKEVAPQRRTSPEAFAKILDARLAQIQTVLGHKAGEYAQGGDRLHNFRLAARVHGVSMQEALWGMALKHLISVMDLVAGRLPASKATVDEKVGDLINYLILLEAVFAEGRDDA